MTCLDNNFAYLICCVYTTLFLCTLIVCNYMLAHIYKHKLYICIITYQYSDSATEMFYVHSNNFSSVWV